MSLQEKLSKAGPRKLLALDGGGIRGIITIEVLAEIEALLRRELHRDQCFVLADYFDYIAGTSTGAIIATCLSLGWSVQRIRDFYHTQAEAMFDGASLDDCNLQLPLWQLVRASTAAPTYFPPEVVQVGPQHFIFVDGGVTMYELVASFPECTHGPPWPCDRPRAVAKCGAVRKIRGTLRQYIG